MARTQEYWLQLENHPWDAAPWGLDRLAGQHLQRNGDGRYLSASAEILILRPYTAGWQQPAPQALNPWDLTEPEDGCLPSAVLTAKVGDEILVHFRNLDRRGGRSAAERTHSLHPHGVQREARFDGAYPLSPPDPEQGNAQGDRVAPGEHFTYHWTCPHRSAAGVWLLHDHAVQGAAATALGAFGVLRIFAPGEQEADEPSQPPRGPGEGVLHFGHLPEPPRRADYLLVYHELPGLGLCLNGRRPFGCTPLLMAGERTRMTVRVLNACRRPLAFHMHGHRWQQGERWLDGELLGPGAGLTLSLRSSSAEHGGGPGEWMIMGQMEDQRVVASLVVHEEGPLTLPLDA